MSCQNRACRSRANGLAKSVTAYLSLAACKNGVAITKSPNCQSWITKSFGFKASDADYEANWRIVKPGNPEVRSPGSSRLDLRASQNLESSLGLEVSRQVPAKAGTPKRQQSRLPCHLTSFFHHRPFSTNQ